MASKKPDPADEPEGTELIPLSSADAALMASIQAMEEIEPGDPDEIQRQIIERYLSATTVDEILAPQTTTKAEMILGQVIVLHDAHFNRSTVMDQGAPPVYAIIDAWVNGKREAVTCGSRNVMAQIISLSRVGALPLPVVIDKLPTKTSRGFQPMYLTAAPPGWEPSDGAADEEQF